MSEHEKVARDDLAKALDALQNIAKGHSSRGTKTTEVESMKDGSVGAGSGAGATQVHHTESNSDRQTWAGSSWDGVADNGPGVDSVGEDGTDYSPQGKVMKNLMAKLADGAQLTAKEFSVLKSVMAKAGAKDDDDKDEDDVAKGKGFDPKKFAKKDDEDDEDDDMDKSLSEFARDDETVSKGLEVSEFLASFAGVVSKSLSQMERRILTQVKSAILSEGEATGDFQKSLAESIVNLGNAIAAVSQRQEQVETAPARGPRAVQALNKGGYSAPANEPLNKALVASTLVDLVQKGQASPQDVIKFESTNELPAHLEAQVRAAVSGR